MSVCVVTGAGRGMGRMCAEPLLGTTEHLVAVDLEAPSLAWGRRGGRVNSISPGIIGTPQAQQELAAHPIMQVMLDHTPLGRFGRAEEIAALAAFLLSDDASFVSGIDILADGAMTQGMRAART